MNYIRKAINNRHDQAPYICVCIYISMYYFSAVEIIFKKF